MPCFKAILLMATLLLPCPQTTHHKDHPAEVPPPGVGRGSGLPVPSG